MEQMVTIKGNVDDRNGFHNNLFNVLCHTLRLAGKTPSEIGEHFGVPTNEVLKALDAEVRFPTKGEVLDAPDIRSVRACSPFRYMTRESFERYRSRLQNIITSIAKEQNSYY